MDVMRIGSLVRPESDGPAPNLIPAGCRKLTPQMFPALQLNAEQIGEIERVVAGGAENIQDIYPLTPLQEGILFHHLLDAQGDVYASPALLEFRSRIELERFVHTLQQVIERHDILRTAMVWEQLPRPVQVVQRRANLRLHETSLDPELELMAQVREWLSPARQRMDLRQAPLIRLLAAAVPNTPKWLLRIQVHHMICDHESLVVIRAEMVAFLEGREYELREPIPFRNHVIRSLAIEKSRAAEAFFRAKLADVSEATAPFGLLDVHGDGSQIEDAREVLESELSQRIRTQARRMRVSVATMFHAAWGLVVAHTSGLDDVVFGTVLFGRMQTRERARQLLGMFLNTLPLRLRLRDISAADLVTHTQRELHELLGHEHSSLSLAQRCSGITGSAPLFTSLLNYRHTPRAVDSGAWASVPGVKQLVGMERTSYPFTVAVDDFGDGFSLLAQTDHRVNPQRIVSFFTTAIQSLVDCLERAPQTAAASLPILPEQERHQLIEVFCPRGSALSTQKLIHELFEDQVDRTPSAVAVSYEKQSLTYAQLNANANQLARYLRDKGVGPDRLVGICVDRSLQMVVGVLAILKAGGAYLPLDPNYPAERLAHILEDAAPSVVLTQQPLRAKLPDSGADLVALDANWGEIAGYPATNFPVRAVGSSNHHLAYVIYTSGSTGKPKGVMVEHANVTRLFSATAAWFNFNDRDVWTLFHSIAFDFSVWELWGGLLYGGRVVVVPYLTARMPDEFYRLICDEGVTVLNQTPSAFAQLIDVQARSEQPCPMLRVVIFGGEALELRALQPWVKRNGAARPQLVNMYGITETTVHVTYRPLTEREIQSERGSPIGGPIPDLKVHLLDRYHNPVPIGVAAEMYVGGAGVARGYLHRPELTAERFIQDPFGNGSHERLYKTGDLGRWLPDGSIEYLGRNDHQVKLRGFRIELGEIEAQLSHHPQVKDAIVLAREDEPGDKRLVAYVVPQTQTRGEAPLSAEILRAHLKPVLPDYMVPSAFMLLERFPLTAHGKLDRRMLPAPELGAYGSRDYEAPEGEVEEILAGIWQELLRVERVGRRDNFFELGGHSLLIVQMLERLRRAGISTEVRRVFARPMLADLADNLARGEVEVFAAPPNRIPVGCEVITPQMLPLVELESAHIQQIARAVPGGAANIQDIYPLAPLQEGLLFHHLLDDQSGDIYARTMLLALPSQQKLETFKHALQSVIDRHDILRTAILWKQLPEPVQVVYRRATLAVEQIALDPACAALEEIKERMRPERQRLDLQRAPLMKLQFAIDPQSQQCYVLLQTHHLVCDNASIDILLSEVIAYFQGRAAELPEPIPYRNHVSQMLASAQAQDDESFFRNKLSTVDAPTVPFGLSEVRGSGGGNKEAHQDLETEFADRVRVQARRSGVSAATLFHAAWALVVAHTAGRNDVVYGTVLLGRLQGSAGAQRILGMFINTLPLRLPLLDTTARGLVERTQQELVQLLNHEQASLALAQRCSGVAGSKPLFSSLLNYRHSARNPDVDRSSSADLVVLALQGDTNYPITVSVDDFGDGFRLTAETDCRIDPQRLVAFTLAAIESLVEALELTPQTPALSLSILPERERHQTTGSSNATPAPEPVTAATPQYEPPRGELEVLLAGIWANVLKLQAVGRNDNFFDIGGHSLLAMKLMTRIADRLSVSPSVITVFRHPTIRDMAQLFGNLGEHRAEQESAIDLTGVPLAPRPDATRAPLSFSQLTWWHSLRLHERPSMRSVVSAVSLSGPLNVDILRGIFTELTGRHESLRTRIATVDGAPMQLIDAPQPFSLETLSVDRGSEAARPRQIRQLIEQFVRRPVYVADGPLFAACLIEISDSQHVLVISGEHSILDGASLGILWREIIQRYTAYVLRRPHTTGNAPAQIGDYAAWQQNAYPSWAKSHATYWKTHLNGAGPVRIAGAGEVPGARGRWSAHPVALENSLSDQLRALSRTEKTSVAMTALTAYAAFILRWCGISDLTVVLVTAGRHHPGIENGVGYFAASLFLRIQLAAEDSFISLIRKVTEEYANANAHADYGAVAAEIPTPEFAWNPRFNWFPRQFNTGTENDIGDCAANTQLAIEPYSLEVLPRDDIEWRADAELQLGDGECIAGAFYHRTDDATSSGRFVSGFLNFITQLANTPSTPIARCQPDPR